MKKEYWFILITYIIMQLSSFLGVPLMAFIYKAFGNNEQGLINNAVTTWLLISFALAFIITLLLLKREIVHPVRNKNALSISRSFLWAIGGIFLALFAQSVAANIEYLIGIDMGSENTEQIVGLIKTAPIVIIVTSILGPILEEIVFRKIIFGSLYQRFNFFVAAIISSLIFSFAHGEPEHTLLYSAMGLTFAYLYVKTKRILVPIFAHVAMNTLVVIMQLNQDWLQKYQNIQSFIGGF